MMKKITVIFCLIFISVTAFGLDNQLSDQRLTEDLMEEIGNRNVGDFIKINIRLAPQFDTKTFVESAKNLSVHKRREQLVTELKQFSNQSQLPLVLELEELEKQNQVGSIKRLWIANLINCYATPSAILQLAKNPLVERIDYDEERVLIEPQEPILVDDENLKEITYNVSIMNVPQVWEMGFTGEDVVVAVLDTGVNYNHVDLANNMWTHPDYPFHGWDFTANTNNPMDNQSHGTHCAGTVAGDGTAGSQTGMAPSAKIMALKVLNDSGSGTEAGVWEAIEFAVEYGAQVLSLSLGWKHAWNPDRSTWRNTMDNTLAAGVVAAVAAGNEGSGQISDPIPGNVRTPGDVPPPWSHPDQPFPGGNSAVVSVGATDSSDNIASFSSRGPVTWQNIDPYNDYPYNPGSGLIRPDVVAPGVSVKSLSNTNTTGYSVKSGTSMATPGVAGVIALMLSKNPNLTPEDISQILEETALTLTPGKNNNTGSGRVDALAAINETSFPGPSYFSHTVIDDQGNDDGLVNASEFIKLDLTLKNQSEGTYENVQATVSTTSPYITMVDGQAFFGTFEPEASIEVLEAISFNVANNIPGLHNIVFFVDATDGDQEWRSRFSIMAHAPKLVIGKIEVDDSEGNGDGVLDPGENANLVLFVENTGTVTIHNILVNYSILDNGNEHITINEVLLSDNSIAPDGFITLTINVTANDETPLGTPLNISFDVTGGSENQYEETGVRQVIIGFVPEYCVSGATSTGDTMCDGIEFGEIVNDTSGSCATYRNFTEDEDLVKEFVLGATYELKVSLGTCNGNYAKGAKVFIDWNYDGDFDDEGETVMVVPAQNANWTATANVTIPSNATLGQKFMRVVVREGSNANTIAPCGTFSWGETQDYRIILVAPQEPVAQFEANPTTTVENDIVSFTDMSLNHPASWSWEFLPGVEGTDFEFVDGTSSTSRHPKVKFVTPNAYTASLTVTNVAGNNALTRENYITINQLTEVPIANFTANHTKIMAGQTVLFNDLSTNIPIVWDWGISPGEEGSDYTFVNGSSKESKNPEVQFNTSGFFTIQLIATNPVGDSEPHIKVDYIEVVASFVMQNGEATICAGMFFDSGGSESNYQNNEDYTFTFHPSRENANIKVDFISFDVESQSTCNWDRLLVFDGENTEATVLGRFCGTTSPGSFIATEGALTFQFISDGIVTRPGWTAIVSCHGPFHNVTFSIMGPDGPIDEAQVELAGHNLTTNHEGLATINLEFGTHYYSVTKEGFLPVTGSFTLSEQMSVEVTMQPIYGVIFNVEANQSPVQGANVNIDGRNLSTTLLGTVTVSLTNGTYDYSVSKEGYMPSSGKVVVEGSPVEVNITLVPFSQITFNVTSNDEPIEGATIAIEQQDIVTNHNGEATISLITGQHSFTVSKDGFQTYEGQVDAVGDPVSVDVVLQPLYTVTFQVATSGGPLHQAEIKIGGQTLHTNNTGHADLALVSGTYEYEVTYLDFPTITGTINIVDEHVFLGVLLETNVFEISLQEVRVFPNPFKGKIYLTGATELKELVVTNINGQEVVRVASLGSDTLEIQTGSLPAGIYLVKLVGKNNEVFTHKMVKQ